MRGSHISSWHIVLWNSGHVPFPQGSVYCSDHFVDVRSHFRSIGVIFKLSQPRSLEVSILLALDAEKTVLSNLQTQKLDHPLQLGEQVPLHVLKVDHVDNLPIIQPVQRVGCPPRGIVLHKLGPLCRTNERTENKSIRKHHYIVQIETWEKEKLLGSFYRRNEGLYLSNL